MSKNIILILADDLGFSDLECFGGEAETPNLNKLASEGLLHTGMYNFARCCPSRAALLTGLYPHQTGIGHMMQNLGNKAYQGYLNESVTIAQTLKEAGYKTAMAGKWHVGGYYDSRAEALSRMNDEAHPTPLTKGFDYFSGTLAGAGSYYCPHTLIEEGAYIIPQKGFYYTDYITEKSCEYIENLKNDKFFLYTAYTAPHYPLHAKEEIIKKYEKAYADGFSETRKKRYKRQLDTGLIDESVKLTEYDGSNWDEVENKDWEARRMAVYAAQIEIMDVGIGKIIKTLETNNLLSDTIIMFTSDNGGCAENIHPDYPENRFSVHEGIKTVPGNITGLMPGDESTYQSYGKSWANVSNTPFRRYKHFADEGGISAPLICYCKGYIPAGGKDNSILSFVDFHETFAAIAGVKIKTEGESFLKVLLGENKKRQAPIIFEHEGNCAVRNDKYKLVKTNGCEWRLYDMQNDRSEMKDLKNALPDIYDEMKKEYHENAKRTGIIEWNKIKKQ